MALLEQPIRLNFFWDSSILYDANGNPYFEGSAKKSWVFRRQISYSDIVEKVFNYRGIDMSTTKLKFILRYPGVVRGCSFVQYNAIEVTDDEDMEHIWSIPNDFKTVGVCVLVQEVHIDPPSSPINHGSSPLVVQSNTMQNNTCVDNDFTFPIPNNVSFNPYGTGANEISSSTSSNSCSTTMRALNASRSYQATENDTTHINLNVNPMATQPSTDDDPTFMDCLGATSDFDGEPDSDGPNDDGCDLDNEDNQNNVNPQCSNFTSSFYSYPCYSDMGSGEPLHEDIEGEHMNIHRWSENDTELRLGMRFTDKAQVLYAVRMWHIQQGREFTVVKSKSTIWTAECKNKTKQNPCSWYIRVIRKQSFSQWQISVLNPDHTCIMRVVNNNHRNLTHKYIARNILHLIRNDPETHVNVIQKEVHNLFQCNCSYKKGWHARKAAVEMLFGSWEDTFKVLPKYMRALQDANPDTILHWKHHQSSHENDKVFNYMFWSFKASISGFAHCRPVISIDGTFLRGAYKSVLLIASSWDANNHIYPLAFAIVDEETTASWSWFLRLLRQYVVLNRTVCLISDRHKGILSAISHQPEWQPPHAVHRFCLRHVRANFKVTFKRKELSDLMYKAGSTSKVTKFNEFMEEIKMRNLEAFNYLAAIHKEKWTLAYDGGYRYGSLTTNLSESLNSVLKKCRALPLKALVEFVYDKLVHYFSKYRDEAAHTVHPFPSTIWRQYVKNEKKARGHTVFYYNIQTGIYRVSTPMRGDGRGNNVYAINISEQSCSCNKWSIFGIPCSHVFAVCRHRGWDPTSFVMPFYSSSNYKLNYEANFYPVANEEMWTEATFILHCNKHNMKSGGPGRLRSRRYRGSMDARNPDSPPRCGNCHMPGHNRRTCVIDSNQTSAS